MNLIKQCVRELKQYEVPQDSNIIKLNQNESPIDIPDDLKSEVFEKLKNLPWNRYPDGSAKALTQEIADYTKFDTAGILTANASNELIQTFIYALCDSGDLIVTICPGFSIYGRVATIMNIPNIEVPLLEDFSFDVPQIITRGEDAKLIIFASPNNPTGTVIPIDAIEEIASNINGVLAVDEAYYEFFKQTAQHLIAQYPNIVVLRTFSKALRLSGARLGYLLGTPQMVSELQKAKLPFSVGIFQQLAGEIMLAHRELFLNVIDMIIQERQKLINNLKKFNILEPIRSHTNFILFTVEGGGAEKLFEDLYKEGVLVRCFDDPLLKDKLRVTVGTPEENDVFLDTLKKILGQ